MKTEVKVESGIEITTGWININTGCNSHCLHCYRRKDIEKVWVNMDLSMAIQVIDFFIGLKLYSCIFIGGEPTLYPGLPQLVKQAKAGEIPEVTVVTNGRLLKDQRRVDELFACGIDIFSITIHSASSTIHDKISQVPSWRDTVRGIKNVVGRGRKCSLNVVANDFNFDRIPEDLQMMLEWGVDEIIVSCAIPFFDDERVDGTYALNPRRFAQLIEKIKSFPRKVKILHELPLCLISPETLLQLTQEDRLGYGCHVGIGRGLSVDVDGTVIPCNSFPHYAVLALFENGKLRFTPEEFLELWVTDQTVQSVRDAVNVHRSEICGRCGLWELCNCGCPIMWGAFNPEEFISDRLLGVREDQIQP